MNIDEILFPLTRKEKADIQAVNHQISKCDAVIARIDEELAKIERSRQLEAEAR